MNESAINPACGRPYGGPLLKWDWGTSTFQLVAGIKAAGVRVTVMPETHMPWIVDGCGQLRGWSRTLKNLYGPPPQGQVFDVTAANGICKALRLCSQLPCLVVRDGWHASMPAWLPTLRHHVF